jgi:hypothetical protein
MASDEKGFLERKRRELLREDKKGTEIPFAPSTIETIDGAMLNYIDRDLDLRVQSSSGFKKVPVIWASAERAFQTKRDAGIRDKEGTLILPLISIERTGIDKSPDKKAIVWADIIPKNDAKGGSLPVARVINQIKTSQFANADSVRQVGDVKPKIKFATKPETNKVVYNTISMPLPVYVSVKYEITVRTEYQQQMNEIMQAFVTTPGGVNYILISNEDHTYEGFVGSSYSYNNNLKSYTSEERKFETKYEINVLGYLIGQGANQKRPTYSIRENVVDVKISRERVALGDELEHEDGKFYREF